MTNSSPQNSQPTETSSYTPEEVQRIRQNVRNRTTQEVTEEWIAIIVAFGTIGAILFWSLGGRKSDLPSLSQGSFFSSPKQTTETTANLDLDSQNVVATENTGSLNITATTDNARIRDTSTSARSTTSREKDNLNRTNNLFPSVPVTTLNPSVTKAAIPRTGLESPPTDTGAIAFSNLSEQHWAYPFISKLGEEKLLPNAQGFKPDDPINRAEMASLISSAFKDTPFNEAPKEFTDIPANSNLVADINKAVALGFMDGYSEGDFRPEKNISRYEVLVSLATGLKLEPSGNSEAILQNFSDSEELPEWSLDKVAAATEAGLAINRPGFAPTSLNPNEPATRAEVAAMIYQSLATSGTVPKIASEYVVPKP